MIMQRIYKNISPVLFNCLVVVVLIVVYYSWSSFIYQPLVAKTVAYATQVNTMKSELNSYRAKNNLTGKSFFTRENFMSPDQVSLYLSQVLSAVNEIKLVGLEHSPGEKVPAKKIFEHVFGGGLTSLVQYQFTLKLKGGFKQVLAVLVSLNQQQGIFWQRVNFSIGEYPAAETTLVFTVYSKV